MREATTAAMMGEPGARQSYLNEPNSSALVCHTTHPARQAYTHNDPANAEQSGSSSEAGSERSTRASERASERANQRPSSN